nr:hypothetical protein [Tanacetum cinerariifolium]
MTDYSLWEVILNGDSPSPTRIVDGAVQIVAPTTAEQRLAKKNELKARGSLLMALPNKHQLNFNIHKDAKSLMEAIEKRFRDNKETKKEDIKLKFLRSLPSEWKTHTLIWRNKANLEDQSLDDLFNKLKIYEAEVKVLRLQFLLFQNVDSLSDAVIYTFFPSQSNSPQLDNEDLKQIDPANLEEIDLKWQMAMLTIRARRFLKRTGRNLDANGTDPIGFEMSKVECYNCHRKGHFTRECRSPRDNRNKDTPRRTIPAEADEEPTSYALTTYASSSSSSYLGSYNETSSKNLSKLLESQVSDKTGLGFDSQVFNSQVFDYEELHSHESDNSVPKNLENDRYKTGEGYHAVPPLYTETFLLPKPDLVFSDDPNANESVANVFNVESSTNNPSKDMSKTLTPDAPIFEDWISDFEDENEIESVPKQREPSIVKSSKHVKSSRESIKKVEHPKQASNLRTNNQKSRGHKTNWNNKACFVCRSLNHLIKDCNYYEQKMANPEQALKNKGVIDSGCSRHTTGNISFLLYFKEIDGGYVAFGGNPKGGKISGKMQN